VLLGDVGAGKSSLVLRFVKDQFVEFQVNGSSIDVYVVVFTFCVCFLTLIYVYVIGINHWCCFFLTNVSCERCHCEV